MPTIAEILASNNLANIIDGQQLEKILDDAQTGYDEDKLSRTDWEQRQEKAMKLALQVVEVKNTPWPNAANTKYPLMTTAAMQFGARCYPGLIPSPNIVKGRVSGFDPKGKKAIRAERIGKHMSYQLIEEMDDWEEGMDKLSISVPITGCMFKKTYYSPVKQKNISELVYPKHLIINYWTKTLKTAPRITHEIYLSDNDIYERIGAGIFTDQEYTKDTVEGDQTINEVHGIQEPARDETTPHLFKEQHTWIDLDGDGYKEPYIVVFGDSKIARIVACFDEESVKRDGENIIFIERTEYFTKYGFVPSPDGSFYDIGFDVLLVPVNESINTTLNQLHDSGTMATRAGGFLGRGAKIKGGKHAFKPFEWQNVQSSGEDIRKNILPLPVRDPSQVLFSLLGLLIEAGKELSNTVPMLMGQSPGQNQPATTSMAVIEQGLKVYSAIFKRLHRSLKSEVKKLKRLNRINLPPQAYFQVLDPKVDPKTGVSGAAELIFAEDYNDDETDVQLYSDPNIISELQRTVKAQQIGELLKLGAIPNRDEGIKIILEAMDLPNVEKLLEQPKPKPNPELELEIQKVKADAEYKMRALQGELSEKADRLDIDRDRLALDKRIADDKAELNETVRLLNLAKAESEGYGLTIKAYEAELKELKIHAESEKRQARESKQVNK